MRRTLCIAAAALALATLSTTDLYAQRTRGQGSRIGTRTETQSRMSRRGYVPGVQLTPAQRQRVGQIRLETRIRERSERRNNHFSFRERQRRIGDIRRHGHDRIIIILTPSQRNDFYQWWDVRQQRGYFRYRMRTHVDGHIPGVGLTIDQQQEIAQIRREAQRRMIEVDRDTSLTFRERDEAMIEIRQEERDRILEILTPQQRRELDNWWQNRTTPYGY